MTVPREHQITQLPTELEAALTPNCPCALRAQFIAHIHHTDHCRDDGLTDGAEVMLLCRGCLSKAVEFIRWDIRRRKRPLLSDRVACGTCGRSLARLSDILEIEDL